LGNQKSLTSRQSNSAWKESMGPPSNQNYEDWAYTQEQSVQPICHTNVTMWLQHQESDQNHDQVPWRWSRARQYEAIRYDQETCIHWLDKWLEQKSRQSDGPFEFNE